MASESRPIEGEVVGLEEDGARIRLDGGRVAHLPATDGGTLRIGERHLFRVDQAGSSDDVSITMVKLEVAAPVPNHAFDKEFDRLHDALANHGPHSLRPTHEEKSLGEKEMEGWMSRVDSTISRLRKQRSKRGSSDR